MAVSWHLCSALPWHKPYVCVPRGVFRRVCDNPESHGSREATDGLYNLHLYVPYVGLNILLKLSFELFA